MELTATDAQQADEAHAEKLAESGAIVYASACSASACFLGDAMDDFDAGKQKFVELVKEIDPGVEIVVPTTPSNGMFLISLTKGGNRKFMTVNEDDMLDLSNEAEVATNVSKMVTDAIAAL